MNDKVTYLIEMSDYDFDTAKAMVETKRYFYIAIMYPCNNANSSKKVLGVIIPSTKSQPIDFANTAD